MKVEVVGHDDGPDHAHSLRERRACNCGKEDTLSVRNEEPSDSA